MSTREQASNPLNETATDITSYWLIPQRVRRHAEVKARRSLRCYLVPAGPYGSLPTLQRPSNEHSVFAARPATPLTCARVRMRPDEVFHADTDEMVFLSRDMSNSGIGDGMLAVRASAYPRFRRRLASAATVGQAIDLHVSRSSDDAYWSASEVTDVARERAPTRGELAKYVRESLESAALRMAHERESLLPPLTDPLKWHASEIHTAARELVIHLSRQAYQQGWYPSQLKSRIEDALTLLLDARAGALGRPDSRWRSASDKVSKSVLVLEDLPARLIAEGQNPVTDPRTSLLYKIALPFSVVEKIAYDGDARARLQEVDELTTRYLERRWLNYGPLAIALAQGAIASEHAEYAHVTGMRRGAIQGIWNGRIVSLPAPFDSGEKRSHWRPLMRTVLHSFVMRSLGALIAYGMFLWFDLPFASFAALMGFVWGPVLGSLAWGHIARPEVDKAIQMLGVMQDVYFTTWGSYVPVAALCYAMMTSTYDGIVWPDALWRLVETETRSKRILWKRERRGDLW